MIPQIIHYCWFGGNPLSDLNKKCIESWKHFCPGYEIKEWNESNFDFTGCDYAKEAYDAKKWAFVSDYARFKILYECGGVYFDTDVELIKGINDLIDKGGFMGMEGTSLVAPGLGLAFPVHHPLLKEIIGLYDSLHFAEENGGLNLKTVVDYTTELLYDHGFEAIKEPQNIEGIWVYPAEYFGPYDLKTGKMNITPNTRSIHHYAASWCDPASVVRGKIYRKIAKCFGANTAQNVQKIWRKFKGK